VVATAASNGWRAWLCYEHNQSLLAKGHDSAKMG